MYYVYILYSPRLKKLYKGFSATVKERIDDHNRGKVKSTANGIPWQLIYCEIFTNKKDALIEEKFLKSGKGRERIKYLLSNTFKHIQNDKERWPSG